jgi:endonuclease YncB( thermonuclease family)
MCAYRNWFVRRSVASALVGVLALIPVLLLPARDSVAYSGPPQDTLPQSAASPNALSHNALSGRARVIDGDTIELSGRHVRLEGIDAPETAQTCGRWLIGTWPCGTAAGDALEKLIGGQTVTCDSRGLDKYGRTLGVCFVAGRDVNAEMVREGYAWAFVKYSTSYVQEEAEARALHIGIWQGKAEPAWEFRAHRWAGAEQDAPKGCAIKGNVTAHGRIYHMPWSPWYGKIRIDEAKGKRWFCTEAEALAAGWRPAAVH